MHIINKSLGRINMANWQSFMQNRVQGKEKDIPWFLHDKIKFNKFCIENSIPVPKILEVFDKPIDIDLDSINIPEFILKPSLESSTRGVMVLKRLEGDCYYDSLNRYTFRKNEIIDFQDKYFQENSNNSNKIIIEEKVHDIDSSFSIPRDFKFYAFKGKIALILEINRNLKPSVSLWYDGKFNPINDLSVKCNAPFSRTLSYYTKPTNSDELITLASSVSSLIDTPFASIDIYNSKTGPIMGEVTLAPGGLYHGKHYTLSNDYQDLMGRMWEEAIE